MKWVFKRNYSKLILALVVFSNLKLNFCTDPNVNIEDICELSTERFPSPSHNVSSILKTYEDCLCAVNKYPEGSKSNLLNQLNNKLECFKEDLKQSYYEGNVTHNEIELVEFFGNNMLEKGLHFSDNRVPTVQKKCSNIRLARSTVKHIIPLAITGTSTEKQKACEAIFRQKAALSNNQTDIPTPKFDNNKDPKQLTVPLVEPVIYRVDSPESENALTQFYVGVMKCLTLTNQHKILVFKFNKKFYNWLTQAVLPHLTDDKCYPAFGGILRIVETMRQNDFVPKNATASFLFYRQKNLEKKAEGLRKKEDNMKKILKSPYFSLILVPWLLFILLFLSFLGWRTGYCLCCGGFRDPNEDQDDYPAEVFYYPIEETPSISLDLDELSLKEGGVISPRGSRSSETRTSRQRGGDDYQIYSMTYEEENSIVGLPLKRQWESKGSSASRIEVTSPGKRYKKM